MTNWIDPKVSLGNVITIGGMVGVALIGWGAFTTQLDANRLAIVEVEAELSSLEARLRSLEREDARAEVRFTNITSQLSRIEAAVDRIAEATQ